MSVLLIVAAILVVVLAAAHSYIGERYILIRLFRRADLPQLFGSDVFTKRTLRFAWHLTTVAWLGLAALLALTAQPGGAPGARSVGAVVATTAAVSAVVTFVGSRARHLAWTVFLAVAAAAWLGSR